MSTVDTSQSVANQQAAAAAAASGASSGSSSSSADAADLNFNDFLKLLTTQLQNQDPLNPTDSTQFTSQIAQFSSVEQQIQSNAYLKTLTQQQSYSQQSMAVGFIGKDVLVPSDDIGLKNSAATFDYTLGTDAVSGSIQIYNEATGAVVKTITPESKAGTYQYNWDGTDDSGNPVADGTYGITMKAYDSSGTAVKTKTMVYQAVAGVQTANVTDSTTGAKSLQTYLVMSDGSQVQLNDVFDVRDPSLFAASNANSSTDTSNTSGDESTDASDAN